jgi:methionine-S-sulfoxide reductase
MITRCPTLATTAALLAIGACATFLSSCNNTTNTTSTPAAAMTQPKSTTATDPNLETITFGSGCFWCTEAVFQNVRGVKSAVSGYSGGQKPDPTYEQVCSGATGHAEVVQVTYDPREIAFEDLLQVFWRTHDPTTLNRQGHDVGTQYRSAIFYHNDRQREIAEQYKKQLNESESFGAPIVTEITPFEKFYPAEKYHQEYYDLNPNQGYCQAIIRPKVEKFKKEFSNLVTTKQEN